MRARGCQSGPLATRGATETQRALCLAAARKAVTAQLDELRVGSIVCLTEVRAPHDSLGAEMIHENVDDARWRALFQDGRIQ